jgi:hypothetical protein
MGPPACRAACSFAPVRRAKDKPPLMTSAARCITSI